MRSCHRSAAAGVVVALLLTGCADDGPPATPTPATGPSASAAPEPTPGSVTLAATGDVLIHQGGALTAGALQADGSYDFSAVYAGIAPVLQAADLAICHLETPLAPVGGPYRGYPDFAVQPEIVDALAGAGYDVCSTASNHSLDDGLPGVVRTLDDLDAAGIAHAGTYRTAAEEQTPTVVDVGGVRVGQVAATFSLNGVPLPPGAPFAVDTFTVPDVAPVLAAAARARAAGAEIVVASIHCCQEYDHEPTAAQQSAVATLLASPDVDLVLGHHAHVVQPFELIDGEWVAYGLGNSLAEHATRGYDTEDSVIARFTFTRGPGGRFTVTRAEAVPVSIVLGAESVRLLPADPVTTQRISATLDARGAVAAGLEIVPG